MVIAAEDLLEYYIHDPDTRVIAMFLEGIRHPKRFMELASRALEAGKPIVALKVGLTDRGSRISKGHTGSLQVPGASMRRLWKKRASFRSTILMRCLKP